MVPTFTCGLVRSNLPFAIFHFSRKEHAPVCWFSVSAESLMPADWQTGGALRRRFNDELLGSAASSDDRVGNVLRSFAVVLELHRVRGTALRHRTQGRRVAEHF